MKALSSVDSNLVRRLPLGALPLVTHTTALTGDWFADLIRIPGGEMTYREFWSYYQSDLLRQMGEHFAVVAIAAGIAAVLGIAMSMAVYRRDGVSELLIRITSTMLTIPSLALYVLLLGITGLGWSPVLVALTIYALCPIVQNTIVGLRGVDPAAIEAATGIGMLRWQTLARVEIPLAWPLILTGIRIAAALLVSTAAIGAVVLGPGLGNAIYAGLNRIGSPVALYFALSGLVGAAIVGLLLSGAFSIIQKLTVSRGIRG
ncbi:ABC transporter permease [Nocardia sp. NPDC024068]|uniref:ABC transporter permease n=1 Tax=Nocardia sp. NPDC024068 TaxID=3157197 RepID=UPI0033FFC937